MHTDNITYIKPTSSNSEPNITLNDILAEIDTWRTTKISRSEKIPAAIWNQIFILAESIAESKILTTLMFNINIIPCFYVKKRSKYHHNQHDINAFLLQVLASNPYARIRVNLSDKICVK